MVYFQSTMLPWNGDAKVSVQHILHWLVFYIIFLLKFYFTLMHSEHDLFLETEVEAKSFSQ